MDITRIPEDIKLNKCKNHLEIKKTSDLMIPKGDVFNDLLMQVRYCTIFSFVFLFLYSYFQ